MLSFKSQVVYFAKPNLIGCVYDITSYLTNLDNEYETDYNATKEA